MPPIQLPLPLAQRHNNQQLFSNRYLNGAAPWPTGWKLESYSWPHDLSDEDILACLLALNLERAASQGNNHA